MSVYYRMRRWYDHWLCMTKLHGSVLPRATLAIGLSAGANVLYHQYLIPRHDVTETLVNNPVGFNFFMQLTSFILTFSTGICYNRFWEALGHLYTMSAHMATTASIAVATEYSQADDDMVAQSLRWRAEMLHDLSVWHAVCIQGLFTENIRAPLDILGGLTEWEAQELAAVKDQTALVAHWIQCNIGKRCATDPFMLPSAIVSQLYAQLTAANIAYNNAIKVSKVPLPLTFQQALAWADVAVVLFTPLSIAAFTPSLSLSLCLTIVVTLIYHGVYMADISMQQPFGDKTTDLPLIFVHRAFTAKLLSFINPPLAAELNQYIDTHPDVQLDLQMLKSLKPIGVKSVVTTRIPGHAAGRKSEPAPRVSSSTDSSMEQRLSVMAPKLPQLQVYRSTLVDEDFPSELRMPGSKRGSLLMGGSPTAPQKPEGVFYDGKVIAKEVVLPDTLDEQSAPKVMRQRPNEEGRSGSKDRSKDGSVDEVKAAGSDVFSMPVDKI